MFRGSAVANLRASGNSDAITISKGIGSLVQGLGFRALLGEGNNFENTLALDEVELPEA